MGRCPRARALVQAVVRADLWLWESAVPAGTQGAEGPRE